jgi:hypothetical protein
VGGLLLLSVVFGWLLLCIWLAKSVASTIRHGLAKALVACVVFVGLFVAPVADDILGVVQYERFCKSNDIRLVGTIDVRAEAGLHSENGDWLLSKLEPSQHQERHRISRLAEGFLRQDIGSSRPTPAQSSVSERTDRIYEASSGRLLVEITSYHYRGGFLRRSLLDSASQCFSERSGSELYQQLFSFTNS